MKYLRLLTPQHVGYTLKVLGVVIFLLCFWVPQGILLGGDPAYLGAWESHIGFWFPLSAGALVLALIGTIIGHKTREIEARQIIFLLAFWAIWMVLNIHSIHPEVSFLYGFIWFLGLISVTFGATFVIRGVPKQTLLLAGMVIGTFVSVYFPEVGVSRELLGFAALLSMICTMRDTYFPYRMIFLLSQVGVLFMSQNPWLVLLGLGLGITSRIWASQIRFERQQVSFWGPGLLLVGLSFWGWGHGHFASLWSWEFLPHFFEKVGRIFFGVGEGQFLPALAQLSEIYLQPDQWGWPGSGFLSVWYEKGLIGLLALIGLLLTPILFHAQKSRLWMGVFVWGLLFTQDLWITSEGILFVCVLLLAQEEKAGKFENKL